MDGLRDLLNAIRLQGLEQGRFRGLLHLLIGRGISLSSGTVVSTGLTWRELALLLKKVRWDTEAVRELGLDPASLPPRDRQRYWYAAINQAQVHSPAARAEAEQLVAALQVLGYAVGPSSRE